MIRNEDLRYERKFILDDNSINKFESLGYLLPISFFEKYQPRRINSIYYDTDELQLARDSFNGLYNRHKIRIRYYGDIDQFESPHLEIKSKYGHVGKKDIYPLNKLDFDIRNLSLSDFWNKNNLNPLLEASLFCLKPKVIISYLRNYYLSNCYKYRFTFDRNICFSLVGENSYLHGIDCGSFLKYSPKILELKYSKSVESHAYFLTQKLPLRLTSCSKYCTAIKNLGLLSLY